MQCGSGVGRPGAADLAEVREAEAFGGFQAVAQQTIAADVRAPDEPDAEQGRARHAGQMEPQSDPEDGQRGGVGVREIVEQRPDPRAGQLTEHGEIGREKEHAEPEPAQAEMLIKQGGGGERRQPLYPEPDADKRSVHA